MMSTTYSLREALNSRGISLPASVRSNFQCYPRSLREIIRVLQLPKLELENWPNPEKVVTFHEGWKWKFQGIVKSSGDSWYFINKDTILLVDWGDRVYVRKSIQLAQIPCPGDYDHCGAGCLYKAPTGETMLLIPIEGNGPPIIAVLTENLEPCGFAGLSQKQDNNAAWCAINPWDGQLYVCDDVEYPSLYAYDPFGLVELYNYGYAGGGTELYCTKRFALLDSDGRPARFGSTVFNMAGPVWKPGSQQGGAFSSNGRFYLAHCNVHPGPLGDHYHNYIHVFDVLTGRKLGAREIHTDTYQEIEGIALVDDWLYISIYQNYNVPSGDTDVDIIRMKHPNPEHPL